MIVGMSFGGGENFFAVFLGLDPRID
jgi:hypothetical protein